MPEKLVPGTTLDDRYTIEAELGHGGMATVYRATDGDTGDQVAVKVLKGELAQAIGAQRFAREIDIASTLDHPNVVSLLDSGASNDVLYCVMPLFEGETLRDRLDREGQLPIDDALTIADAVAQALDFAHDKDIVHRDVKPENILLSGDRVGLADFGIARAVIQAEEGSKLTSTGIVVGTPSYMSPEQASADKVDRRSDIYALGCVLYELLSGGQPFAAPTQQATLARHALDPVPDIRTIRPGLPEPVWLAVKRAMAKAPADRFKTAGDFMAATRRAPVVMTRDWRKVLGGVVGVSAVAGATVVIGNVVGGAGDRPLVDSLVAVLPFSLQAQASDSSDLWLASAIPVSIGPLLEGTAGLTAVSERRTDEALRDLGKSWDDRLTATEAAEVARRVGAGSYLMGNVMSGGGERVVTANLYDTRTGEELMDPVRVRLDTLGPVTAVDRIYGQILITLVGEDARAGGLLTRSSAALRSYVDGVRARRDRRPVEASRSFLEALRADSTFPLASLAFLESLMWLPDGSRYLDDRQSVTAIALASRDGLSEPDRALLDGIVATYDRRVSGAEKLEILRRGTVAASDHPSAWLMLGDFLLHDGRLLDYEDHVALAVEAFDSAMAKGNPWPETNRHLSEIRFVQGDTAFIREYTDSHRPEDGGFNALWWGGIWLLQDTAATRRFDESMAALPRTAYPQIMVWAQRLGVGLAQADRAADLYAASPTVYEEEASETKGDLRAYHLNRGRPGAFMKVYADSREWDDARAAAELLWFSFGGIDDWVDQDSLRQRVERGLPDLSELDRQTAFCTLGQWHARWSDSSTALRMVDSLRASLDGPSTEWHLFDRVCLRLIVATVDRTASMATLRQVDSLLSGRPVMGWGLYPLTLALAELYEARGAYHDALRLSKRVRFLVTEDYWHTPALVMEGRLSLAVGDTARAIDAYTRALALLSDPEPQVEPVVQEMRATLAELLAR